MIFSGCGLRYMTLRRAFSGRMKPVPRMVKRAHAQSAIVMRATYSCRWPPALTPEPVSPQRKKPPPAPPNWTAQSRLPFVQLQGRLCRKGNIKSNHFVSFHSSCRVFFGGMAGRVAKRRLGWSKGTVGWDGAKRNPSLAAIMPGIATLHPAYDACLPAPHIVVMWVCYVCGG
jgi:hypothetical protein